MIVKELWRYPVKSLGGERIESVEAGEYGLDGDRRWGIEDNTTGLILTARREPLLLLASAELDGTDSVIITLPDGTKAGDDKTLSSWLGRGVSLVAAGDDEVSYESPNDFENDKDWYSFTGPGIALHDSSRSRISLVSEETIGEWDVRRFRPNIVLGGRGEDDLVGHTFKIGTCTLNVTKQISRCVMVTRPQPDIERDLEVLKTINRQRGGKLSIGALVPKPGEIKIGDQIGQVSDISGA